MTDIQSNTQVQPLDADLAMETYRAVVEHLRTIYGDDLVADDHFVRQGTGDPAWGQGPVLCQDFEGWTTDTSWAVVWEGGPSEWALLLPLGGRDEYGREVPAAPLPEGVAIDSFNSFAISLYPDR